MLKVFFLMLLGKAGIASSGNPNHYKIRKSLGIILTVLTVLAVVSSKLIAEENRTTQRHTFAIGTNDFLLDGQRFQIRCGEIHAARVPREYWRNRLQSAKAMGLNTVCAYLFWNQMEPRQGEFDWSGQSDLHEYCRIAQEVGLWVILRPGPYACAEWDGGGLPWWLLKKPDIKLRTQDPDFMKAATSWLKEVGRRLGGLQITKGGPILMVQVENEYGSFGDDAEYMGRLRQALMEGGFNVPLFSCNPTGDLRRGLRSDLFQVVNFGRDPESGFKALRAVQPSGPLMCGEFYPGWFDTWGAPHHLGNTAQYLADLEFMLSHGASFSIYMAHGGTTFGLWSGADRPFKPDTSSYDYDAPISEAGWVGEKFNATRTLISKYLSPGETLPNTPLANPVMTIPEFALEETAPILDNLSESVADSIPQNFESHDQGHGCAVYRTKLPAGAAATLSFEGGVHDFAWAFIEGRQIGVMDRRSRRYQVRLPARDKASDLNILVESVGHVNFGNEIHDRKGLFGPARIMTAEATNDFDNEWTFHPIRMDSRMLSALKWKNVPVKGPSFWRGEFVVTKKADTFLDLRQWGKGLVWINGHCLARYWNIGPTQTAYLPGPWLLDGTNEIVILDLLGPQRSVVSGLATPILDQLRPALDFARNSGPKGKLNLGGRTAVFSGSFAEGSEPQTIDFAEPVEGRQFCMECLNAQDGKPFAAIAELDLLDASGNSISHMDWTIAYVDSEELASEDGSASNAINGQTSDFWHTAWSQEQPGYPHQLVIDLGRKVRIGGFRYTPRAGEKVAGRIKDFQIYLADKLVGE